MEIFCYRSDAMKRILHHCSNAYTRYTSGKISPEKAHSLCLKLKDRYEIERTVQQRFRAKAKGQANSQLVMLFEKESNIVFWWLLVTPGKGLVDQMEDLKDALGRKSRIEFGGYELAIMPRKDRKPSWTWRMTAENKEAWRERLQVAVREYREYKLLKNNPKNNPPYSYPCCNFYCFFFLYSNFCCPYCNSYSCSY